MNGWKIASIVLDIILALLGFFIVWGMIRRMDMQDKQIRAVEEDFQLIKKKEEEREKRCEKDSEK